jgi:hypothetical protein
MATTGRRSENDEIEVSPEMIEVGEIIILREVGGAELGGTFDAADLAREVYLAMKTHQK